MSKKLHVKFWEVPNPDDFQFPEVNDPQLSYQPTIDRLNKRSCGIAFSGGGTVSAALAPGFIKALEDLGVMKNVAYISGVSGGTWGTAAYCYAKSTNGREAYSGGVFTDVKNVSYDTAKSTPPEGSMIYACTDAKITELTFKNILDPHNAYTDAVGEIFLAPFGLYEKGKNYFTTDRKALQNILSRNPNLSEEDFILLYNSDEQGGGEDHPTSPYYIMNGAMLTPPRTTKINPKETYPFEFTPLYCGMKNNQGTDITGEQIGGSYVESFGFGTKSPKIESVENLSGSVSVDKPKKGFDLSHPVGTSGSAVEELIAKLLPGYIPNPLLYFLPSFPYWNPQGKKVSKTQRYLFGDGGLAEDTGLSALLARKVENIVLFITEPFDITPLTDRSCEAGQRRFGYNQIAGLFGADKYNKSNQLEPDLNPLFQFFETEDFEALKQSLTEAKKASGPIVVQGSYTVKENKRFGIQGGWTTHITWVVVDTCENFNTQLDSSLYANGKFVPEELNNFPAICTFLQNPKEGHLKIGVGKFHIDKSYPYLIQLTNAQANLLAAQAYWMVQNSLAVKQALGG